MMVDRPVGRAALILLHVDVHAASVRCDGDTTELVLKGPLRSARSSSGGATAWDDQKLHRRGCSVGSGDRGAWPGATRS